MPESDRPPADRTLNAAALDTSRRLALIAVAADAGRLRLDRRHVDLVALTADAVDAHRGVAASAGVTLTASQGDPVVVDGDAGRLRQVLTNLLSNAVRYTPTVG